MKKEAPRRGVGWARDCAGRIDHPVDEVDSALRARKAQATPVVFPGRETSTGKLLPALVRTLEQSWLARMMFLAAMYYAAGRLGLLFTIPTVYASPVWPASGVALAGILFLGYRAWPGIMAGSFFLNVGIAGDPGSMALALKPLAVAASIGAGAAAQALAGAFLIRRFVGFPNALDEGRDVAKFLILAGPLSALVNATWGVTTLLLGSTLLAEDYAFNWWTWWFGDSIGVLVVTPIMIAWVGEPRESWAHRRMLVTLPLCLAAAIALAFFIRADAWEQERIRDAFRDRSASIGDALKASARRHLEVLASIRDFHAASPSFTWPDFQAFVSGPLARYSGVHAVSWNPRIAEAEREEHEKGLRRDGYPDAGIMEHDAQGRLVPAPWRSEYVFVRYVEPYRRNRHALGYNVASEPTRRAALDQARDFGKPVATARIELVQDAHREPSVLVYLPVYRPGSAADTVEQRRASLLGYVTGVFRLPDLVGSSVRKVSQAGLRVLLQDASAPAERRLLYANRGPAHEDARDRWRAARAAIAQDIEMEFAGRQWVLNVSPTAEYLRKHRGWQAWTVLAAGLLFSGFIGAFLLVVTGRAGRFRRLAGRLQFEAKERSRAEEKVRRLNRVYAVLSGINALIVRVRDRNELYREACRVAVEAGRLRMAWLGVYDSNAMSVTPVAWHGHEAGFLGLMALSVRDPDLEGRGLVKRIIREKRPVIVNDIEHDEKFRLGPQALERGYRSGATLPLLVGGEVIGVLGLFAGEAEFFDDEELRLLAELAGDISFALDHIEKAERLDYLAYYDPLTGLANRALFQERLAEHARTAERGRDRFAVCIVDVDRFKTINDACGRQTGDALLKQIAERMTEAAGDPGRLARIGGDRFALVIPGVQTEGDVARRVERKLRACFAPPFMVQSQELRVSAKIGVALFPSDAAGEEALFANAEAALKRAKTTGESYVFYAHEMTERVAEKLSLENKLQQALDKGEFVLHYQPKVGSETRRIDGVEALIRWQSPELGLVPPMQFIPLLEETGLILEVGAWALRQAALDHRGWVERGLPAPSIAVNISARQLRQRDFVAMVTEAARQGVTPHGIDIEITESLIMDDIEGNVDKLKALRALGMKIAIDDFGTGHSSLAYLAKLPVDSLKIDRSFIITMLNSPNAMTLVQTIISLAHSLKLNVVAEGVDGEEQARVLRLLKCDQMQGYLFSKPLPRQELDALLSRDWLAPRSAYVPERRNGLTTSGKAARR